MATLYPHTLVIMATDPGPQTPTAALPWDETTATIEGGHTLTVEWALASSGRPEPVTTTWTSPAGTTARPPVPAGRILTAMRTVLEAQLDASADTLAELGATDHATRYRQIAAASRKRPSGPGRPPGDPRHPDRLQHVAQIYNHAQTQPQIRRTPAKAVREAFPNYAPRTINDWIRHARDAGLIPPR